MEITNIWEQMANRYDTTDRMEIAKIIARAIRAELKDTKNKTALDYGCGTGLVGLELADLFSSMIFVDSSAHMLRFVDQKTLDRHIETATTLCCDFMEEVPLDLKVDYVFMSQVLLHIHNTQLILTRLYDLLQPGGHLIIVDFDKNEAVISEKIHNGFAQPALINLVKQIGFSSAHSHTFHQGKAIFMNQDAALFILDATK